MEPDRDLFGNEIVKDELLRQRFLEPPFSVLDARGGTWRDRKRKWKVLGIRSEVGRDAECNTTTMSGLSAEEYKERYGREPMDGTSIFDPALTELIYNWFCPPGGLILDPFAGGSVRGIVAGYLGFLYTGLELRREQVASNIEQADEILTGREGMRPVWVTGDSENLLATMGVGELPSFDLIFSCPPYHDLEVYSDDPEDLSNMPYDKFINKYERIIKLACSYLKPGGYACFVVGDIRDKKTGYYRDFISHTKRAFIDSGLGLYNECILLQPLGTAMLRAAKIFEAGKKVTKVHENVLIFKK